MSIRKDEHSLLSERIELLIQENNKLKNNISSLRDLLSSNISMFFELSNSIKQTRKRFCYENVRECYKDLVYFYGCAEPVQEAEDYKECYEDIFGQKYTSDFDSDDIDTDDNTIDDYNELIETNF